MTFSAAAVVAVTTTLETRGTVNDKDEKTDLSQCLVDYVKSYGARFLERDEKGWYVIDNITARRKVSQALR